MIAGPGVQAVGRALIFLGVLLAGAGLVLLVAPKLPWIGRLPGDVVIERPHVSFYFPFTSCLLASVLLSLLLRLVGRFR